MKITFLAIFVLLFASKAMAVDGIDKAAIRCKVEVEAFMKKMDGYKGVKFPSERFTSENKNAYFVHYKEDLKALAMFKDGSTLPLDIRCTIGKKEFDPWMVNINGSQVPL